MLGERLNFTIKIDEKEIDLKLTIGVLKDLYKLVGDPYDFLESIVLEENETLLKQEIIQLLICMTDEDIFYINDNVLNNADNVKTIQNAIMIFITEEFQSEFKDVEEEESNEVENVQEKEAPKPSFKDRYNFFYYMAKSQLNLSIEEMEGMTVREMQTMIDMHVQFEKGTLIRAYSDIIKAQNKVKLNQDNNNSNGMIHKKGDRVRIKDMFNNINIK